MSSGKTFGNVTKTHVKYSKVQLEQQWRGKTPFNWRNLQQPQGGRPSASTGWLPSFGIVIVALYWPVKHVVMQLSRLYYYYRGSQKCSLGCVIHTCLYSAIGWSGVVFSCALNLVRNSVSSKTKIYYCRYSKLYFVLNVHMRQFKPALSPTLWYLSLWYLLDFKIYTPHCLSSFNWLLNS